MDQNSTPKEGEKQEKNTSNVGGLVYPSIN